MPYYKEVIRSKSQSGTRNGKLGEAVTIDISDSTISLRGLGDLNSVAG